MKLPQSKYMIQLSLGAFALLSATFSGTAFADRYGGHRSRDLQLCALGSADVGQPGSVVCRSAMTGAATQSVPVGATAAKAGGIAGSLVRQGRSVLVTNQAQGAWLLDIAGGRLGDPIMLDTDGEASFSGALSERGAYVITGTRLLFFPSGTTTAASSQPLLQADGSAAHVVLAGGYAYVTEKSGTLSAVQLGRHGDLRAAPMAVAGVPAGIIVGITAAADLVVAPIAHLASNFDQSSVPVVRGLDVVQIVPTKEVAACWAGSGHGEACVTNPGSMTVSCGRLGPDGFLSYTSASATLPGETVFDVDMKDDLVGILGMSGGAPLFLTFEQSRQDGDFLRPMNQFPVGTATATGLVILPAQR